MTDIYYWDSSCFLSWLLPEPDRAETCKDVIRATEKGDVKLVTSALTLVEVIHLKGNPPITQEKSDKISKFFKNDWIVVVNVERKLSEFARDLIWSNDIMPKDAIHIATALTYKVFNFNTFDEKLLGKSDNIHHPILKHKFLHISKPFHQQQPGLPLKYNSDPLI